MWQTGVICSGFSSRSFTSFSKEICSRGEGQGLEVICFIIHASYWAVCVSICVDSHPGFITFPVRSSLTLQRECSVYPLCIHCALYMSLIIFLNVSYATWSEGCTLYKLVSMETVPEDGRCLINACWMMNKWLNARFIFCLLWDCSLISLPLQCKACGGSPVHACGVTERNGWRIFLKNDEGWGKFIMGWPWTNKWMLDFSNISPAVSNLTCDFEQKHFVFIPFMECSWWCLLRLCFSRTIMSCHK